MATYSYNVYNFSDVTLLHLSLVSHYFKSLCEAYFWYAVQAEVTAIFDVENFIENETNPVTFTCQAIGEPVPNVTWYFNGVTVNTSNLVKYNISNSLHGNMVKSMFTIMNTNLSDVGTYTCHAENIFGEDQKFGILAKNGKKACFIILYLQNNYFCRNNPTIRRGNRINQGREQCYI